MFPRCALATGLLAGLLAGCGVPGPDGPVDSYHIDFTPPVGTTPSGAFVFIVDGLNSRRFNELLAAGQLPSFKRYFVDRGLYCPAAVANVPSVTLANLTAIATGRFPGNVGIPGINFFDRQGYFWRDYATIAQKNTLDDDHDTPLIYEYLQKAFTVSVFFQPHRGASKFFENWTSAGPPFFFGWYDFVDRLTLFRLGEMMALARQRRQWPKLVMIYLLWPDFAAYEHGLGSDDYTRAVRHADRQIGRVLGDLDRAGALDKIVIALVSDHSHSDITRHVDLDDQLEKWGLSLADRQLACDVPQSQRRAYYEQFNTVTYGSGERYRAICLRRPEPGGAGYVPWPKRPTADQLRDYSLEDGRRIDLPARLVGLDSTDAVAWANGPNTAHVLTARGEVRFEQPGGPGGAVTMTVLAGDDPLGYKVVLDSARTVTLASRDWLERTAETDYPDLPAQIVSYFRATDRAGDLAVFARPGMDYTTQHKGGHGGLRGEQDMLVPMALAGPGILHATLPAARTVDLAPTLLTLMGRAVPSSMDGRSVVTPVLQPPSIMP